MLGVPGDSTFSKYLPYKKVKHVTPTALFQVIFQNLTESDVSETYWKSILQFIPRFDMLNQTLNGLVKEKWLEQMPDLLFPSVEDILHECTKIYGNWKLEVYQSVRNEFNGFMSGTIPISEFVLVHEPFENDISASNIMKLTHVRLFMATFFVHLSICLSSCVSVFQGCKNYQSIT